MAEVLNCDVEGCGHVEEVGKITSDMVGMPCPKCGANLLTEEDWIAWQPYSAVLKSMSDVLDADGSGEKVLLRVGLHGPKTSIEITRNMEPEEPEEPSHD